MNGARAISRPLLAVLVSVFVHDASAVQRECVGHYTIDMPGQFEYALARNEFPAETAFANGFVAAWGEIGGLKMKDGSPGNLSITTGTTDSDLDKLFQFENAAPQRKKNEFLDWIKEEDESTTHAVDPTGVGR